MIKHIKITLFSVVAILLLTSGNNKQNLPEANSMHWVDSVFNALTPKERIGQFFMVAAYSNKGEEHKAEITTLIKDYHIGGLIFFQGGPMRQATLTNYYQSISKTPLMIGIDGEWGLSMRLDSTIDFPRQMTLGAIKDNKYIYDMGYEIGLQCQRMGIHVNFAPVIDINVNPKNPVIGMRSFGENKYKVADKGSAYMKGMQSVNVLACAKHFPGHGDTDKDSHKTLPVISHRLERLEEVELFPFRKLFDDSVASVMVAHLHVPYLDNANNRPTTLSPAVVNDLLKRKMRFRGLVFTDALNMNGVASFFKPGEIEVQALLAGNDVLLFPQDVPVAVQAIDEALKNNILSQEELDKRVKKILLAKYWAGLDKPQVIKTENLIQDLNSPKAKALNYKLFEKAITLIHNDRDLIPVRYLDTNTFASVVIGKSDNGVFQKTLSKYTNFEHHNVSPNTITTYSLTKLLNTVKSKKIVVVGLACMNGWSSKNYGITPEIIDFLKALEKQTTVIVVAFGNPYAMQYVQFSKHLICTYQKNDMTEEIAPQLIFGGIGTDGVLPVSSGDSLPSGTGIETESYNRYGFNLPENEGIDSYYLQFIDTVAMEAIAKKATPGCQVLVARNGNIIYNKNFGYLSYKEEKPVDDFTMYDIASITKVAVSTQLFMWLRSNGLVHPDDTISRFLPELVGTNKEFMTYREVLAHQAGLFPFLPFWENTKESKSTYSPQYYNNKENTDFCYRLNDTTYICKSIRDSVFRWNINSKLISPEKDNIYPEKYSDLGYYFIQRTFETITGDPIDVFYEENFTNPLGMNSTCYNPIGKKDTSNIAPTELDTYFRNVLIKGYVHDQGAALMGGVAGHAGLFSTALDLSKLCLMNLNYGQSSGVKYFEKDVLLEFTSQQYVGNRKGMGWDRAKEDGFGNTSEYSSLSSFGHTGFTGTCIWMDPEYDLIYVFLSNRVHPFADNKKLISLSTRTRIHDLIYMGMVSYNSKFNPLLE